VGDKSNQCLIVEEAKKSILFEPKETKTVNFRLYPNIALDEAHYIQTNFTYYSLSEPSTASIKIVKGSYGKEGRVLINDVTPIAHENQLKIQIQLTNFFPQDREITIRIKSDSMDETSTETLASFTSKTISKEISDYNSNAYYLEITTPTSILTQTIVPEKQKIQIIPDENITTTIITQPVDVNKEGSPVDQLVTNPMIIIIVLLAGIALMLFILFWVNKRYV
jgi:hypothetical protein